MKTSTIGSIASAIAISFCMSSAASAASIDLYSDIASSYLSRGSTFNDGMVWQPGFDVYDFKLGETEIPLSLGIWANMDLEEVKDGDAVVYEKGKFSEVDFNMDLAIPTGTDKVGFSIGYLTYFYPGQDAETDNLLTAKISVDTILNPWAKVLYGFDGGCEKTAWIDFGVKEGYDIQDTDCSVGAFVTGYYYLNAEGEDGLASVQAGVSASWKIITVKASYFAQCDDEILSDSSYVKEWLGSIGICQTF